MKRPRIRPQHRNRDYHYRSRYGISYDEYVEMVRVRGGRCDACGELPRSNSRAASVLAVDHDHQTKKVRGLLCIGCNVAVGQIEHELYEKRLAYLRRWEDTQ